MTKIIEYLIKDTYKHWIEMLRDIQKKDKNIERYIEKKEFVKGNKIM